MSGSGWGSYIPFELGTNTQATSIDNGSGNSVYKIVGYYESNGQYNSFELLPPYYADPTPLPSPPGDPNYFYATGISDSHMVAGYANVPGGVGNTCSVCGFVYDDHTQSWSPQLQDPKEGTGACAKTYFTAIDDSGIAVGYYLHNAPPPQNTCISQAFEEYSYQTGAPQFVDLHPLTATGATPYESTANAINNKGTVVGTYATTQGSPVVGWEYDEFGYSQIQNGNDSTQALGVNWQQDVVGSYVDSAGTHGFLRYTSSGAKQYLMLDEPNADGVTVANSVDDHKHIAGWFQVQHGNLEGFVWACHSSSTGTGYCAGDSANDGSPKGRVRSMQSSKEGL